jgi:hypothetical protein
MSRFEYIGRIRGVRPSLEGRGVSSSRVRLDEDTKYIKDLTDKNNRLLEARIVAHQERVEVDLVRLGIPNCKFEPQVCTRCGKETYSSISRVREMGWKEIGKGSWFCKVCYKLEKYEISKIMKGVSG